MEELNRELLNRIDKIAEKLGTTGEKIWQVLVKQASVEIVSNAVGCFIAACGGLFFGLASRSMYLRSTRAVADGDWIFGSVIALVAVVICVIVFGCTLVGMYECYANPEYFALKELSRLFKPESKE